MDKIQISKSMVIGRGETKDAGYQTNLRPAVPIAIIQIYGEKLRLRMDYFKRHDGDIGSFAFEVLDGNRSIASGNAEFLLGSEEIKGIQFNAVSDVPNLDNMEKFVEKCIFLLNEFNYAEWLEKMNEKENGGDGNSSTAAKGRKTYRIIPKAEAANKLPVFEAELLEALRNEDKAFPACNKDNQPANKTLANGVRSYVRRTTTWYSRGYYDRHGRYHPFRFKRSQIAAGEDYAKYRVPIH